MFCRLETIGTFLILFGIMFADSEKLVVPSTIMAIGIAMVLIGKRKEVDHDE